MRDEMDYEGQCDNEDCTFDDTVTLRIEGHDGYWRCPNCDTDHRVDMADLGPDPDDHHDRKMTDD